MDLSKFLAPAIQPIRDQNPLPKDRAAYPSAKNGRFGDDAIIHLNRKRELPVVDVVLKALGGAGSRNPVDGALEYWASSDGNHMQGGGGSPSAGGSGSGKGTAGGGRNNGLSDQDILSKDGWGSGTDSNGPSITREKPGTITDGSGGGTYTSMEYTPGSVPNVPDASPGQLANMFTSAVPVAGAVNAAVNAGDAIASGNFSSLDGGPLGRAIDAMFGTEPGQQRGWAPPRDHGEANGVGGASDGSDGIMSASNSPLRMLRMVPTQAPDDYAALLASLQNPRIYSSGDPVIVR